MGLLERFGLVRLTDEDLKRNGYIRRRDADSAAIIVGGIARASAIEFGYRQGMEEGFKHVKPAVDALKAIIEWSDAADPPLSDPGRSPWADEFMRRIAKGREAIEGLTAKAQAKR